MFLSINLVIEILQILRVITIFGFPLFQRCKWWRDTGLTRINPRDVATAARARARASPGPILPPQLSSTLTMGTEPSALDLGSKTLHSDSHTSTSTPISETVPSFTLTAQPQAALAVSQLSLLNIALRNVANFGAES